MDAFNDMDLDALRKANPGYSLLLDMLQRCPRFLAASQLDAQVCLLLEILSNNDHTFYLI